MTDKLSAEATKQFIQNIFGKPSSSPVDINSGIFTNVAKIDPKYITRKPVGYIYLNIFTPVMNLSGFPSLKENDNQLFRLKLSDKSSYSNTNYSLGWCTAGGQIRFRTDASIIQIEVELHHMNQGMKHFAPSGVSGMDVYVGTGTARKFKATILPISEPSYTGSVNLGGGTKEVLINFPMYAGVKSMSIGFPSSARIAEPLPRAYDKPIVFYGSSITQGGCASRPGTAYFNILSRALDANIVNLGFSGSAFGEQAIAKYIASVEMSAFVFDYDHNADYPILSKTHYPFYEIVRKTHPNIPIIFISRVNYDKDNVQDELCRYTISSNKDKAVAAGDKNVYFIDGSLFFDQDNPLDYTVDGVHPTDLGFRVMAEDIFQILSPAMKN